MSAPRVARPVDTTPLFAVAALVAALAALALSAGTIPAPPTDPTTWARWWSDTEPALALGGVLRTLAMLCAAYLLVITLADVVAAAAGLRGLARVAHRLAPAAWRAVVLRPLTAGALAVPVLVAPTVGPLTTAVAAAEDLQDVDDTPGGEASIRADVDGPILTMTWGGAPSTDPSEPDPDPAEPARPTPTPTIVVAPSDPPAPDPEPNPHTAPPPVTGPASAPQADEIPEADTPAPTVSPSPVSPSAPAFAPVGAVDHVVLPGDSFWSIAEQQVAAQLGREPTTGEVGAYWRRLVAANEDRLPVPGNADLIYAGMVLVLPEG